ncbi:hypothetical protein AVEN_251397-1 [Araneus ventricosus]|uniref:Uncharacterized protein n=1 Tax=Araneus ventricosus TaxID=182803 RepID=A0A4Y2S0C7_ARAVE|nr:hypothetical protein AVEN_251397-1 [Araneus ventricosus]
MAEAFIMSDSMIHRSEEKSALEDDWLEFQLKRIITPRPRSFIGRVELPSNREISNDIKEWGMAEATVTDIVWEIGY